METKSRFNTPKSVVYISNNIAFYSVDLHLQNYPKGGNLVYGIWIKNGIISIINDCSILNNLLNQSHNQTETLLQGLIAFQEVIKNYNENV